MNCLNYTRLISGIDKPDKLTESYSHYAYHAKIMVETIEKQAGQTFKTWKSLKEYYLQKLDNTDFVAMDNNNIINCKSIIEKFCLIEVAENTWLLAPEQFESIIVQNYPHINISELYNYMAVFSKPEISLSVYHCQREKFADFGFEIDKYLEILGEWMFSYTAVNKLGFEYADDQTYILAGKAMAEWLTPQEIEFWLANTIRLRYGDSIWESYWYWIRTQIIFNICKHSSFRLTIKAFQELLNSGLLEFDIETEKELDNLDEFYCFNELAGIILYHNYQSPMADQILYFKRVRDRLIAGEKYDDLKFMFDKYKCEIKKPQRGWSTIIPKSS